VGTEHGRASSGWLALREPADAAARAPELVEEVRRHLPAGEPATIYDLGCGTGSMARWLAVQLDGPQHWVMVDRDAELLTVAASSGPDRAADGARVTSETRQGDLTRLAPAQLDRAALITASALLDMMTGDELDRFVAACVRAGCPALVTLSDTGRVHLEPHDPLDQRVGQAFNAHQRRTVDGHSLLGPDAVGAAVDGFERAGADVLVRPSPWRLGAPERELAQQWFTGWFGAACEQEPELAAEAGPYARRRLDAAAAGELSVTVHHQDLWVRPR
jgi:SAM-dependent methyltransferase